MRAGFSSRVILARSAHQQVPCYGCESNLYSAFVSAVNCIRLYAIPIARPLRGDPALVQQHTVCRYLHVVATSRDAQHARSLGQHDYDLTPPDSMADHTRVILHMDLGELPAHSSTLPPCGPSSRCHCC